MAIHAVPFKPIVEALDDVVASAGCVALLAAEQATPLGGELGLAVERLAVALWELQEIRQRVAALAAELGAPPLHVVGP